MKRLLIAVLLALPAILHAEGKGPVYSVEIRVVSLPATAVSEAELHNVEKLLTHKNTDVLAAPKITVPANQQGTIELVQEIAYFAPANSLYTLRRAEVGIRAAVKVIPTDGDLVTLNAHITQTTMTGRQKLPDVNLEVGEPLLEKQEIKTVVNTKLGKNTSLGGSKTNTATGKQDYLLVIARVTREAK